MRFSAIFIFILIIAGLALIAFFASPKKERYKKKYKKTDRTKNDIGDEEDKDWINKCN